VGDAKGLDKKTQLVVANAPVGVPPFCVPGSGPLDKPGLRYEKTTWGHPENARSGSGRKQALSIGQSKRGHSRQARRRIREKC